MQGGRLQHRDRQAPEGSSEEEETPAPARAGAACPHGLSYSTPGVGSRHGDLRDAPSPLRRLLPRDLRQGDARRRAPDAADGLGGAGEQRTRVARRARHRLHLRRRRVRGHDARQSGRLPALADRPPGAAQGPLHARPVAGAARNQDARPGAPRTDRRPDPAPRGGGARLGQGRGFGRPAAGHQHRLGHRARGDRRGEWGQPALVPALLAE
jgi:hypothetical protein